MSGHNNPPEAATFEEICDVVKSQVEKALKKGEKADLMRGSATQSIACAIIVYHAALVDHGDKPSAWSDLREGKAAGTFKTDFVTNIVGIPLKPANADASKGERDALARERNAASNRTTEGLKLACAMITLGLTPECMDSKTGLLRIPTAKFIPAGCEWSRETYGAMPESMLLDGRAFKVIKPAATGTGYSDVTVFRDAKSLAVIAAGGAKKRGAKSNQKDGGETQPDANPLKGKTAAEQADLLSRSAKDVVLVNADFPMLLRAVAKQIADLSRSDAAPITPGTYSKETRKHMAAIAEYYNGMVAPALAEAA